LGNGTTTSSELAVKVTGLPSGTVTAISAGTYYTCAIVSDTAWCWGSNSSGQLGNGTTTDSRTPVAVNGLPSGTVTAIDASGERETEYEYVVDAEHTCAIVNGGAWCWGGNNSGQLGNGTTTSSTAPVAVTGLPLGTKVTAISAGEQHTCAIVSGVAQCWGNNDSGQLGYVDYITTPVAVLKGE
jgi:alpha-tubulin suppressor-like RCC1 family protein